jgi:hypothetical protein
LNPAAFLLYQSFTEVTTPKSRMSANSIMPAYAARCGRKIVARRDRVRKRLFSPAPLHKPPRYATITPKRKLYTKCIHKPRAPRAEPAPAIRQNNL